MAIRKAIAKAAGVRFVRVSAWAGMEMANDDASEDLDKSLFVSTSIYDKPMFHGRLLLLEAQFCDLLRDFLHLNSNGSYTLLFSFSANTDVYQPGINLSEAVSNLKKVVESNSFQVEFNLVSVSIQF